MEDIMGVSGIASSLFDRTEYVKQAENTAQGDDGKGRVLAGFSSRSRGSDTVSISDEAMALVERKTEEKAEKDRLAALELEGAGDAIGLKDITRDLDKRLMELGARDFAAFRKTLEDLKSGDAGRFLDALSEITGLDREALQASIKDMSDSELEALAQALGKATGVDFQEFLGTLKTIRGDENATA